jgi:hypothetical protein
VRILDKWNVEALAEIRLRWELKIGTTIAILGNDGMMKGFELADLNFDFSKQPGCPQHFSESGVSDDLVI